MIHFFKILVYVLDYWFYRENIEYTGWVFTLYISDMQLAFQKQKHFI